jgi:hypothetical protein
MRQQTLYDTDFYQWTQEQAALLRDGKARDLDWSNLAEEIESLGRSDRRALGSYVQGVVMHLLKWQYQPTGRQTGHSWRSTIDTGRDAIHDLVDESPSLGPQCRPLLQKHYPRARREASRETGLPLARFPEECPWDVAQVLDDTFWPEG